MSIKKQAKQEMEVTVDHLVKEIQNIRTGRANPGMVENLQVEVYGAQMKLKEVASITTPESRQLLISPFDQNNSAAIGKSIEKANIGFMPIVEANLVRINIPPMDANLRKEMIKLLHKKREDAKISVRHVRAKFNKMAKADDSLTEDDVKHHEKEIQDLTDNYCTKVDEVCQKKETEISTI
jgi:ribosome recycling factor